MVCFFEFLTPLLWGAISFSFFNPFLLILSVLDVPRGGLQVRFGLQKQQSPFLAATF